MAQESSQANVIILTEQYHVEGAVQRGPDGSLWDFKHRPEDTFLTVYNAQFFDLTSGERLYDTEKVRLTKTHLVALFFQDDVAYRASANE